MNKINLCGIETDTSSPIITFHPKLDILNSNIGEVLLAEYISKSYGVKPLWVPYTFDTGFKSGVDKNKAPLGVYFENELISLISPNKTGNRPLCLSKRFNQDNIKRFIKEIKKAFSKSLSIYKTQIDEIKFGHLLFYLKQPKKLNELSTEFNNSLNDLTEILNDATKFNRLSDQLIHTTLQLFEKNRISIDAMPIDRILAEDNSLIDLILSNYPETYSLIGDNIKVINDKYGRVPLRFENNVFIADKELSSKELKEKFQRREATISGDLFFAILNHYGFQTTLGGKRTINYYDALFEKAEQIASAWGEQFNLKYLHHDTQGHPFKYNIKETAAVLRILDKTASRNLLVNGKFEIPKDIADHLAFLSGIEQVPEQFRNSEFFSGKSALEKKMESLQYVIDQLRLIGTNDNSEKLKELAKKVSCKITDKGYLQRVLEEKKESLEQYISSILKDVELEQAFLGGTINGTYKDGVVAHSHRHPGLISLILLGESITPLTNFYFDEQKSNSNPYCLSSIKSPRQELDVSRTYSNPKELEKRLLAPKLLPKKIRTSDWKQ
jgi:hypothetical protein